MIDRTLPLRQQQAAFTRDRLLEAGRQLFAADGYVPVSVDEIARAAGASRATFYVHFRGGKCQLATALLDENLPRERSRFRALDALLDEDCPLLRKQLHGWLEERLDALTDETDVSHALYQAAIVESRIEEHQLRICEAVIDTLDRYLGDRAGPARIAVRTRVLLLEIGTQRALALARMSRLPADSVLETLADLWFETLSADQRRAE
jgi:AcrR family transcriptional regulator